MSYVTRRSSSLATDEHRGNPKRPRLSDQAKGQARRARSRDKRDNRRGRPDLPPGFMLCSGSEEEGRSLKKRKNGGAVLNGRRKKPRLSAISTPGQNCLLEAANPYPLSSAHRGTKRTRTKLQEKKAEDRNWFSDEPDESDEPVQKRRKGTKESSNAPAQSQRRRRLQPQRGRHMPIDPSRVVPMLARRVARSRHHIGRRVAVQQAEDRLLENYSNLFTLDPRRAAMPCEAPFANFMRKRNVVVGKRFQPSKRVGPGC